MAPLFDQDSGPGGRNRPAHGAPPATAERDESGLWAEPADAGAKYPDGADSIRTESGPGGDGVVAELVDGDREVPPNGGPGPTEDGTGAGETSSPDLIDTPSARRADGDTAVDGALSGDEAVTDSDGTSGHGPVTHAGGDRPATEVGPHGPPDPPEPPTAPAGPETVARPEGPSEPETAETESDAPVEVGKSDAPVEVAEPDPSEPTTGGAPQPAAETTLDDLPPPPSVAPAPVPERASQAPVSDEPATPAFVPAAPSSAGPAPSQHREVTTLRPVGVSDRVADVLHRLVQWPTPVRAHSDQQASSLVRLFVLAVTVGVVAAGALAGVVFLIIGLLGHGSGG